VEFLELITQGGSDSDEHRFYLSMAFLAPKERFVCRKIDCCSLFVAHLREASFGKKYLPHMNVILFRGAGLRGFKQSLRNLVPSILVLLLAISASTALIYSAIDGEKAGIKLNVGVAFCGNTTAEAVLLIDRVESYTNLFVLNSAGNPISRNQTIIEEICDHAVSNGLKIIINLGYNSTGRRFSPNWFWKLTSLDGIKQRWTERWGDKFLGIYYSDEPSGIQLDRDWLFRLAECLEPATTEFVHCNSLSLCQCNTESSWDLREDSGS
jgi:hypothetical protein